MSRARRRGPRTGGSILIVIGLAIFALQGVAFAAPSLAVFAMGSVFLIAYLRSHNYGLLIPGCILMGSGLAVMGGSIAGPGEALSAVGMGIGFLSIYVIDRLYSGRTHFWPLIPGSIILAGGVSSLGLPAALVGAALPLVLVATGLMFFLGGVARSRGAAQPHDLPARAERPELKDPYARALDDLPYAEGAATDLDFDTAVGFDDDEAEPPREMRMGG